MKKILIILLCCCVVLAGLVYLYRPSSDTGPLTDEEILQTAEDAYEYALPLVLMDLTMKNATNVTEISGAPVNQFFHVRSTASAADRMVVRPNVDTLYSMAYLNLKDEPLILTKPETQTYCSVVILDAYTNCVAVLGTGGIDNGKASVYALCGPDDHSSIPDGAVRISLPTDMAWIIVRTAYDGLELSQVYEIQNEFSLVPESSYGDPGYVPPAGSYDPAYNYVPVQKLFSMDIESFFNDFNDLSIDNPGTNADQPALKNFAKIGVGAGLVFSLEGFSSDVQGKMGGIPAEYIAAIASGDIQSEMFSMEINNWMYPDDNIAHFGTDYRLRAVVAITGLGANPVEMAVYPSASYDKDGDVLDGNNNYVIHFEKDMFPPCSAFWSITAYGQDMFLIDNPIDKYAVRYTDDFTYNPDGSVDIYLQNESPGSELTGNWLPVPKGEFSLSMRIYLPDASVLDFTWEPPYIVKA